jgi:hypothetical protein
MSPEDVSEQSLVVSTNEELQRGRADARRVSTTYTSEYKMSPRRENTPLGVMALATLLRDASKAHTISYLVL